MVARAVRPFWLLHAREARAHAIILCTVLWIVAAVALLRPGPLDPYGKLKFPDFVHFYTLGDLAAAGRFDALYDAVAQHERQVELVPESAPLLFSPIYGPHTSLIFRPFAGLPYLAAAWIWVGLSALVYALVVRAVWRSTAEFLPDRWFVAVAAAAFPPFWSLVLHGQTTIVPLVAFVLAWKALVRGRTFAAGLALGLLAFKPQFGVLLAVATVASGAWVLILGAATSIALQAGAVALVMGPEVLASYTEAMLQIPAAGSLLEPRPFNMHSIRAWTRLLPEGIEAGVYGAAVLVVGWLASRVWSSRGSLQLRFAVVILAACLASPHFFVFNATVLVLPLLWIGGWVQEPSQAHLRRVFWPLVYGLFAFLLLPSAALVGLQVSVALQAAILWLVLREMRRQGGDFGGSGEDGLNLETRKV